MANVRTFLDLSTRHLPERVMNAPLNSIEGVVAFQDEYGEWLWVPQEVVAHAQAYLGHGFPPFVLAIQSYARSLGCDYIRLDRDGPIDPQLPTWDW